MSVKSKIQSLLAAIYNSANALYQNRERNGELWHTIGINNKHISEVK